MLGPLNGRGAALAFIPPLVFVTALSFFLGVSTLLARSAFRAALEAWHRPVRLTAAALLVFMAAFASGGALAGLGWRPSGPSLAVVATLAFFLGVLALLLARPPSRAALEAWHRPRRLMAAATLVLMAGFAVGGALARLGLA